MSERPTQRRLRVIPLGDCSVTIPIMRLQKRKLTASSIIDAGCLKWPLCMSFGSALQLLDVLHGRKTIPTELEDYCYADGVLPPAPLPDARERLNRADIALLETSTPIEWRFRDYILNRFRVRLHVKSAFKPLGEDESRLADKWVGDLQKRGMSEHGPLMIQTLDAANNTDETLRQIIMECTTHLDEEAELRTKLKALLAQLPVPVGVVLYNFRYLSDGRVLDWPAGFKKNVRNAVTSINPDIPIFDPTEMVQRAGPEVAMASPDSGHYADAFYEVVADEYLPFIRAVMGKQAFAVS